MIQFLIAPDASNILHHVFYEIGCRLGIPFSIVSDPEELSSDALVIRYGNNKPISTSARVLELSKSTEGQAQYVKYKNLDLWGIPGIDSPPDVVCGCLDLLQFSHEREIISVDRDQFNRIPGNHHPLVLQGLSTTPLFENNVELIASELEQQGVSGQRKNPWGGPGKYAVCMSHDVDGPILHKPFPLLRSLAYSLRGDPYERTALELGLITWLKKRPDPYWNFENWMRLERHFGINATYFFYPGCGAKVKRHARDPRYDISEPPFLGIMDQIHSSGAEIGLHNPILGHHPEGYADSVKRLKSCSGIKVEGNRAHYWAIDWQNPYKDWQAMSEVGLGYDSSLNPLALGYRGGSMLPISPSFRWNTSERPFVVFPTSIMDAYCVLRLAAEDSKAISADLDRLLQNAATRGGLVVLDWHVRTLSNVGAWKGYLAPLVGILKSLASDSNCRFLSHSQAADDWSTHCRQLFVKP